MSERNYYIDAQCRQMIAMVSSFEHACTVAAKEDDGKISKEEEKLLKKITAAAERFKKELNRLTLQ